MLWPAEKEGRRRRTERPRALPRSCSRRDSSDSSGAPCLPAALIAARAQLAQLPGAAPAPAPAPPCRAASGRAAALRGLEEGPASPKPRAPPSGPARKVGSGRRGRRFSRSRPGRGAAVAPGSAYRGRGGCEGLLWAARGSAAPSQARGASAARPPQPAPLGGGTRRPRAPGKPWVSGKGLPCARRPTRSGAVLSPHLCPGTRGTRVPGPREAVSGWYPRKARAPWLRGAVPKAARWSPSSSRYFLYKGECPGQSGIFLRMVLYPWASGKRKLRSRELSDFPQNPSW